MEEENSIFGLYLGFCRRNSETDPPKTKRHLICWDGDQLHLFLMRYSGNGHWIRWDNSICKNVTHWADPSAFQITHVGTVEKTYETWTSDLREGHKVKCIDHIIGSDVPVIQGVYTVEKTNANGIVLKEFRGKGTYPYRYFSRVYPEKDYTHTGSDVSV